MEVANPSRPVVHFGPFEVDPATGELRNGKRKVCLQEQPLQIFLMLLEHKGSPVTRGELRQRLWPDGTIVDFDHSINIAINKLREALEDDAELPRFIETLPRRGYRLIVPVERPEVEPAAVSKAPAPMRSWKIWLAAGGILIIVLAASLVFWRRQQARRVHTLDPSDTIVLADFVNTTGDPVFDDALKQALTVQLEQSPFLNMLPETRVHDTLRFMGRPTNERLTPELGRDLCQRAEGAALITGSIARLGSQYVIGLTASGCSSGRVLATEQIQTANKEGVLKALGKAASDLRSKLGESLSSVEKYDVPIYEATTPSLEALRAYSLAREATTNNLAISSYERAIELDPNFAMAYAGLAGSQRSLGRLDLAKRAAIKAFALRDRVSERERFRISALYYALAPWDLERAIQVYRQWAEAYPTDVIPHINLGGLLAELGRWEEAAAEEREALRLDPSNRWAYSNLVVYLLRLGQTDAATTVVHQALQVRVGFDYLRWQMYELAFLRGDIGEMERLLVEVGGKESEGQLLAAHSRTQAYYGHLLRARYFSRRAVESELQTGSTEVATVWQARAALYEAEFGSPALARQGVSATLAAVPTWYEKMMAALALARIGDTARAKALARELERDNPSNTILNFYWLPAINAAIEIKAGHPDGAIAVLEVTSRYDLGADATMYPTYLRGEAYLLKHDGIAAAAEFQKLLDHRGIVLNYPLAALAHLQLGRAYAVSGNAAKAKAAYQDFLTLWKDADPDIPTLKQAKAEYGKLQ